MVTWKSVVPHCCPFVARPHCARLLKDAPQAESSFKRFQTFKKNLMKHHDATTETCLYHQHVWDVHAFSSTLEAFHPTIPGSLPKHDRAANPLCSKSWRFKANRLRLRLWKLWKRVANCPGILSKQIDDDVVTSAHTNYDKLWDTDNKQWGMKDEQGIEHYETSEANRLPRASPVKLALCSP